LDFLRISGNDLNDALFSPNGKKILIKFSFSAQVLDRQSHKRIAILKGHNGYITSASFSHDRQKIVTGCYDHKARIWDANSGAFLTSLEDHTNFVTSAVFSPDDKTVITSSEDNTCKVWGARSG
jgi:WD40 repeat protein